MATGMTPAMPAAPSAPSAPAASPAPSAPSTTSSAPSPSTPPAPASTAAPISATTAQPAAPAQAAPASAAAPSGGEPKAENYPGTPDGTARFLTDHHRWQREQKEKGGQAQADPNAAPQPGAEAGLEKPVTEAAALAEATGQKPEEAAAAPASLAAEAPTPQALAAMMEQSPEFKAALEAHPEIKGPLFQMARKLAGAEPVLELIPNRAAAEFHTKNSADMVGLKTASLRMIDNPENEGAFLEMFDSQFAMTDDKGQPVMDERGQPRYADDRKAALEAIVGRETKAALETHKAELDQLNRKLETGVYPNAAARAADERRAKLLDEATTALEVAAMVRDGSYFEDDAPQLPTDATAEVKAWFEEQQAKLRSQKDELDKQKRGAGREERQAKRQEFLKQVRADKGTAAGTVIGEQLKQVIDAGVYIPQFVLDEKVRDAQGNETGTSRVAFDIFNEFERRLHRPGSQTLLKITEQDLLPETPATRQMRAEWYRQQAVALIPEIVKDWTAKISKQVQADRERLGASAAGKAQAAQPEPRSASSSLPQGASEDELWKRAEAAAQALPEWKTASLPDREAMKSTQFHRIKGRNYGGR